MTGLRIVYGAFFAVVGATHLVVPGYYRRQVPPWVPSEHAVVFGSGVAEIGIGIALIADIVPRLAAAAAAALLLCYLPAHVHALRVADAPAQVRFARLRFPVNALYFVIAVVLVVAS